MKEYIESRIEALKYTLSWKEEECERSRLSLVELVSECTAEKIACGWLDSHIDTISREVGEIKNLREQIKMLEYILTHEAAGDQNG